MDTLSENSCAAVERRDKGLERAENPAGFNRLYRLAGAGVLAAVFAASFSWELLNTGRSICAFRNLTGLPCPGCGLTRSFASISHGAFAEAFRLHPVGPLVYAGLAFYMVKWGVEFAANRPVAAQLEDRLRMPVLWGLVVLLIAVWIIRLVSGTLV